MTAPGGAPSWFATAGGLLLGVAGAAILYGVAVRWSGRKRQWSVRPSQAVLLITIIPAIGAALVLVGIAIVAGQPLAGPLVLVALGVLSLGVVLHMSQPDWWGPRWYREVQTAVRHRAPRPLTRFERATFDGRPGPGGRRGAGHAVEAVAGGELVARWPASWVREAKLGEAAHGVRLFDEVSGFLELSASRVAFRSDWYADTVRGVPIAVAFEPRDVKGVRIVAEGADAYSVVIRGARRSATPGLVVETEEGPFLFGVDQVDEAARLVAEFAGLHDPPREAPAASPSILASWQPAVGDPEALIGLLDTAEAMAGGAGKAGEDIPPSRFELVRYSHPSTGFSLPLPDGWARAEDRNGVALIAAEPPGAPWLRSSVIVTIERLAPGTTLAAWLDASLERLPEALDQFFLIDVEEIPDGDQAARRVLAHHTTPSGAAVTVEQWLVVEGPLGYAVTVSVATLDYDAFAPFSARIGGGFRPDPKFRP